MIYYDIIKILDDQLSLDDFVNTVTRGDIYDIDLNKQTIFPLSHIMVNSVAKENNILRVNITIMCMDIVDINKAETTDILRLNDRDWET